MAVDAARRDVAAGGIDLLRGGAEAFAERDDAAIADADVGRLRIGRSHRPRIADHEVERCAHGPRFRKFRTTTVMKPGRG